jgi:cytochrome c biogenesis protein CcmG/thiol:disulfide interchange protein DsbE
MYIGQCTMRLFCLLSIALLLVACAGRDPAMPAPGAPAPPLVLPTLNDDTVRLADFQGQVVLVNFWASWCAPCIREMRRLQQWHAQHNADGLVVLGVNTLFQDSRTAVEAFLQDNKITYPILVDKQGELSRQWLAQQLPRSYIVDRQGMVRFTHLGEITERDFEAHIAPLLREAIP